MAGFSPNDMRQIRSNEEEKLKEHIIEAWSIMVKTNWGIKTHCIYNPQERIQYPMAMSLKKFYDNEGWDVHIMDEVSNYKFAIYLPVGA